MQRRQEWRMSVCRTEWHVVFTSWKEILASVVRFNIILNVSLPSSVGWEYIFSALWLTDFFLPYHRKNVLIVPFTGAQSQNLLPLRKHMQKWQTVDLSRRSLRVKARYCSVARSCLTFGKPMDCSMPGFPVLQHLLSFLKLMSIESVMPSNHLILCCPLLFLPSIFPNIRVFFPNKLALCRGDQSIGASASASVLPLNIQGWFLLGMAWLWHCPSTRRLPNPRLKPFLKTGSWNEDRTDQ